MQRQQLILELGLNNAKFTELVRSKGLEDKDSYTDTEVAKLKPAQRPQPHANGNSKGNGHSTSTNIVPHQQNFNADTQAAIESLHQSGNRIRGLTAKSTEYAHAYASDVEAQRAQEQDDLAARIAYLADPRIFLAETFIKAGAMLGEGNVSVPEMEKPYAQNDQRSIPRFNPQLGKQALPSSN